VTPHSLRAGEVLEHRFDTRDAGEVWAALTLAAPAVRPVWFVCRLPADRPRAPLRGLATAGLTAGWGPGSYLRFCRRSFMV